MSSSRNLFVVCALSASIAGVVGSAPVPKESVEVKVRPVQIEPNDAAADLDASGLFRAGSRWSGEAIVEQSNGVQKKVVAVGLCTSAKVQILIVGDPNDVVFMDETAFNDSLDTLQDLAVERQIEIVKSKTLRGIP